MVQEHSVISIVPQLPPQVNGLGDQAWLLALDLKKRYNVNTIFFNADTSSEKISSKEFLETKISDNFSNPLQKELANHNASLILLHYVGYGYAASGCPDWIVNGLKEYKKSNPECVVITIFYELYASGKPWQRAFWSHFHQKNLTFQLLDLSNYSITNTDTTFRILKEKSPRQEVLLIPVYSNIGEPSSLPPFAERENVLLIFGGAVLREKIFTKSLDVLAFWIQKLNIQKVIEIGPKRKNRLRSINSVPIEEEGVLSPEKVSEKILNSRFGLLHYPIHLLGKSGVFAAYASHGVVPIVIDDKKVNISKGTTGLEEGVHLVSDYEPSLNFNSIGENIFNWYQQHTLEKMTAKIYSIFFQEGR